MPTIQYSARSARLSMRLSMCREHVQRWQVVKVIWHEAYRRRRRIIKLSAARGALPLIPWPWALVQSSQTSAVGSQSCARMHPTVPYHFSKPSATPSTIRRKGCLIGIGNIIHYYFRQKQTTWNALLPRRIKAKFHYASWFKAGSNQLRTSFESPSVVEFGFKRQRNIQQTPRTVVVNGQPLLRQSQKNILVQTAVTECRIRLIRRCRHNTLATER